jgi:hypothetical protein
MTKNVEGQTPEGQEPTPAGEVSGQTEAQLSQQGSSSGVSQEDFDSFKQELLSQVGGLQGAWDKQTQQVKNEFEATLAKLNVELSPAQKQELRILQLEDQLGKTDNGTSPPSEVVTPGSDGVQSYSKADVLKEVFGDNLENVPDELWDDFEKPISEHQYKDRAVLLARSLSKEAPLNPASAVMPTGKAVGS